MALQGRENGFIDNGGDDGTDDKHGGTE